MHLLAYSIYASLTLLSGHVPSRALGSSVIGASAIVSASLPSTLSYAPTTTTNGAGVVFGYYSSWSIYDRDYQVQDIPYAGSLTHLLYAFFEPDVDGTVRPGDAWADLEKPMDGDDTSAPGKNLYGNLKQLGLLKKRFRRLKVLLGIGGFTGSASFSAIAASSTRRMQFARTAVMWMLDLGLDGIDVDWEFPATSTDAANFVLLLRDVRQVLTASHNYMKRWDIASQPFLLTAAYSGSPSRLAVVRSSLYAMSRFLDFVNIMAYDYSGSWSTKTGHHAQLFGASSASGASSDSGSAAIILVTNTGVPRSKVVLGVPAYGRAFQNTTAALGAKFTGVGSGEWEAGVYDYKSLPRSGAIIAEDSVAFAATSYDPSSRELVSFDTARTAAWKATWTRRNYLAGVMLWELSGDRPGSGSLVLAMKGVIDLSVNGTDRSLNRLNYTVASRYVNVKWGFV